MMMTHYINWGLIPYDEAWQRQREWFQEALTAKQKHEEVEQRIIFCQHPHVYTLGKHGHGVNMLLNEEQLKRIDATLFHIERGGDITYHGPGQLVCYPIIDLEAFHLGLKDYVHLLEEVVIRVCALYGITATRSQGATGVWLEVGTPKERKICAIGVKCSRYVTMHGLAFNLNTDLTYFSYIHPCGFIDKGVTSLTKELGKSIEEAKVMQQMQMTFDALLFK